MAVTAETTPKATPDVAKINGMASRTLWVSKLGAKGSPSQVVIPAWKGVSADQIDQLHSTLARDFGPGTYKFEVADGTGPEKDSWTAKLGGDTPEGSMSNGYPGAPITSINPGGEGTLRDLGHGYLYNESLGLLTTPARELFEWRPGMPLPLPGRSGVQTSTLPPWASQIPGWGTMPATDGDSSRTRALENQIADERRRREMDEVKNTFAKLVEDTNRRFEMLVEKLTARPTGPDPMVVELQTRLAQQEQAQRTQLENAQREERHRADLQAIQLRFEAVAKELGGNKQDPVLMMLTQVMQAAQTANAETVKAMQAAAQVSANSSERQSQLVADRLSSSVMSPIQMVEMIKMAKDTSSTEGVNRQMVEMFQSVFGMAKDLIKEQAEMNASGSGPAWLPIAQEALQRVGSVAQAYAARQTQPMPQVAPPRRAQTRPQPRQVGTVEHPQVLPPSPAPLRPLTAAEVRDQAAREAHLFQPGATAAPAVAAPAAVQPAQQPQASAPPAATPKKRRGRAQSSSVPAAPPPPTVSPADLLRAAPIEDVRGEVAQFSDEKFFGPFHSQVLKLREAVVNEGLAPAQTAQAVLMSRAYFQSYGELPPAIELLNANQVEVLVERLLPDVDDAYREEVVIEIRAQTEAEAAPGDDQEGDEDEEAA
jgi:hypothetical protein